MGDDVTNYNIVGIGPMNVLLNGKRIRILAYYTPALQTTLISITKHIEYVGCYFHAEDNAYTLAYLRAIIEPTIKNEVTLNIQSATHLPSTSEYVFDFLTDALVEKQASTQQKAYKVIDTNMNKHLPTLKSKSKFSEIVTFKKLHPNAKLPKQGTTGSIGFDVYLPSSITLPPKQITKIPTGLAASFPNTMYLRITDRSSLALQNLSIKGGVVDSDFRGNITILMQNNTEVPITFTQDQKVAQFIFEKAAVPQIVLAESLDETERKEGAFGSTDNTVKRYMRSKHFFKRLFISPNTTLLYSNNNKQQPLRIQHKEAGAKYARLMAAAKVSKDDYVKNHPTLIPENQVEKFIATTNPSKQEILQHQSKQPKQTKPVNVIPSTYSVNKLLPQNMRVDRKFIELGTGLANTDAVIQQMAEVSNNKLTVSKDINPIQDPGIHATINSPRSNKKPSNPPPRYSQIWHVDIGYGPCRAIGGIRYTLLLIDKSTRFKYIFGLKNLTSSIHEAMEEFLSVCGTKPELIRTDFDTKLIGGRVKDLLRKNHISIQAAPPKRQQQNGLVEQHWALLVKQARQWLTSALLPTSYWWFAIKRACEISNIIKASHKMENVSPYELVTGIKPDYRQMIPIFSVAYMKYAQEEKKAGRKWTTQSLKVIAVGS